ncbi:MAG: hypothetical protein IJT96_07860 [Lachnospiraceae bacterium]|nr:hypothetical protein [Lachnospiraceae bacterium]
MDSAVMNGTGEIPTIPNKMRRTTRKNGDTQKTPGNLEDICETLSN